MLITDHYHYVIGFVLHALIQINLANSTQNTYLEVTWPNNCLDELIYDADPHITLICILVKIRKVPTNRELQNNIITSSYTFNVLFISIKQIIWSVLSFRNWSVVSNFIILWHISIRWHSGGKYLIAHCNKSNLRWHINK